jgi:hypothetical protein
MNTFQGYSCASSNIDPPYCRVTKATEDKLWIHIMVEHEMPRMALERRARVVYPKDGDYYTCNYCSKRSKSIMRIDCHHRRYHAYPVVPFP